MFPSRFPGVRIIFVRALLCFIAIGSQPVWGQSLPPAADIPEEILQTVIDEKASSAFDGQAMPPGAYAQQRDSLHIKEEDLPARLAPEVYQVIVLLRVRSVVRGILPFL
jgi:hypothetical protein